MQTFQDTIAIARHVGEVFAFLAELRNIPRWNYAIARTLRPRRAWPGCAPPTHRSQSEPCSGDVPAPDFQVRAAHRGRGPGQLASVRAAGNRVMPPTPAARTSAVNRPTPGSVVSSVTREPASACWRSRLNASICRPAKAVWTSC